MRTTKATPNPAAHDGIESYSNDPGEDTADNELRLEAYELEALWQLTEQGEYPFDWGVIAEFEWQRDNGDWEAATALITSRTWGRWVATSNLWVKYEWQADGDKEFETALALQGRYRLVSWFEPALEFYAGENTRAFGPVAMGDLRLQPGKKTTLGIRGFDWT